MQKNINFTDYLKKRTGPLDLENSYFLYIVSLLLLIPACEFISQCLGVPFFTQPYLIAGYGIWGIIMFFNHLIQRKNHLVLYPSDIFFLLLIAFTFISYVFTCNPMNTYEGFDYDEWIQHFYAYYSLLFAGTMVQDTGKRKKIIYTYAGIAAFHCIIAWGQTVGFELTYLYFTPEEFASIHGIYGLTQNRNWFGGLSVVFVAVSSGCYLFYKESKKRLLFLLVCCLSLYCSMCCKSRLTWVGIACILIFYIISFIVMRKRTELSVIKKRFAFLLLLFAITLFLSEMCYQAISFNVERTQQQGIKGGLNAISSSRLYIWKYGLESVPNHWLTGIGLDNYSQAFRENPSWNSTMFYQDKGHNEYIHTLVTQGVFAALNYIIMLIYACVIGVKTVLHTEDCEERNVSWILLAIFIGYATQAFFNSSVINIAPYFWAVVGLTMPKKHQRPLFRLASKTKANS